MCIPDWFKFTILNLPSYVSNSCAVDSFFMNYNLNIFVLGLLMLVSLPIWLTLFVTNVLTTYKTFLLKHLPKTLGKLAEKQFVTNLSKISKFLLVCLFVISLPSYLYLYNNPIPLNIAEICNNNVRLLYERNPLSKIKLNFNAFIVPADVSLRFFGIIGLVSISYYRVINVINSLQLNRINKRIVIILSAGIVRVILYNVISLTVIGKDGITFYEVFYLSNQVVSYLSFLMLTIVICFNFNKILKHLINPVLSNKSKIIVIYNYLLNLRRILNNTLLAVRIFSRLQCV